MLKNFSIVEFADGMQIIPSNWMDADGQRSIWPSHIKNLYSLNRTIMNGIVPVDRDKWEKWDIVRVVCLSRYIYFIISIIYTPRQNERNTIICAKILGHFQKAVLV